MPFFKKKKPKAPAHYDHFNEQACLPELVVVLHGIKSTPRSMKKMNNFLSACGYAVASPCLDYDHHDVAGIVDQIHEKLGDKIKNYKKVHFVGYSLGGMALRAYLSQHYPENMGNAIQVGSPNQGSFAMRMLMWIPGVKTLAGPMAVQVSRKAKKDGVDLKPTEKPAKFFPDKIPYKLGIIAGDAVKGLRDFFHSVVIPGGDDGLVSFSESAFKGMRDHIIIDDNHVGLRTNNKSFLLIAHFLKKGTFAPYTPKMLENLNPRRKILGFLKPCMKGSIDRLLVPTRWFRKNSRKQIEAMKSFINQNNPFD